VARGSAHVEAWGSAHVEAWDSAHVEAWDSAHVVARGSAHVEAWDSAHVVARDSAHVVARSPLAVLVARSAGPTLKGGIIVNGYEQSTDPARWLEAVAAEMVDEKTALLYKRTADNFATRAPDSGGSPIIYAIDTEVIAPDWDPSPGRECGGGLHLCPTPPCCDQFRKEDGDRYVACAVSVEDILVHPTPEYPSKIRARSCRVLYECDREGKRVEEVSTKGARSRSRRKKAPPEEEAQQDGD
jgi:hypothetical protein